ncbi:iron ABC transporter permease [Salipaludibacillus neizhouensis]|uniref:Iron ABC transporter permease n=1 Tax=Salipaludibacillus neizhouensis TaxID=885475 RepID=A0A3A9K7S9_9BACI|nr:ABC transporter permease [Salipaludibacillus neizhouensis]RKL66401.1 iron ABC transporter permease [Salipaludibacillus neizhouensis]
MKLKYLIFLLIVVAFSSLFIGVSPLSPMDLFSMTDQQSHIFWTSRIPRLVSIIIAGTGMSIAGLIMQQLTRNKFVSPTTAGTMDSARLGILVSMMVFASAGPITRLLVAMAFAIAGTFLFMKILDKVKFKDPIFIPLVGLMFGNIIGSITTFFAYKYDLIQNMSAWLQGNFATTMSGNYETLYIAVPLVFLSYMFANRFTLAGMGEDFSKNLGLNYRQVVNLGLIIVAIITSTVVITVGMIPFLGLVVPNIVTIFRGDNIRKNLPHTAALGAVFVLICDMLGRIIIFPYEIPIGLTVGVIGSGLFLFLLLRRKKYGL